MKNKLVIGIGGCGSNFLKKCKSVDYLKLLAINTDKDRQKKLNIFNKILLGNHGNPCKGKVDLAIKILEEDNNFHNEFLEFVNDYNKIFVVFGLGGGTGTGVGYKITELLIQNNKNINIVCTYPFPFEGVVRKEIADTYINKISKITKDLRIFNNNDLINKMNKQGRENDILLEGFNILDELMLETIKAESLKN